jgi:hypothetical protein
MDALAQEADAQEAEAQDAFAQDALAQDALAQEAEAQDAFAQEAFDCAMFAHEAASKAFWPVAGSVPTNWFSDAFGLGGLVTEFARCACAMPTPSAQVDARPAGRAVSMRAPLT